MLQRYGAILGAIPNTLHTALLRDMRSANFPFKYMIFFFYWMTELRENSVFMKCSVLLSLFNSQYNIALVLLFFVFISLYSCIKRLQYNDRRILTERLALKQVQTNSNAEYLAGVIVCIFRSMRSMIF